MASFLQQLIAQNTRNIQGIAGHKLAESMGGAKRKEKGWRSKVGILKTLSETLLPGWGHAIGAMIDPIGRKVFGAGADEDDITLDKKHQIFGGKGALKTAKEGLGDAIEDYKQSNILNSIISFAGSEVGETVLKKWGSELKDSLKFGGDNLPNVGITGAEAGDYADALDDLYTQGKGSPQGGWTDKLFRESSVVRSGGRGYEQGGMVKGKDSLVSRLREQYLTDPKGLQI